MTTPAPLIVARRYELHDLVGKGGCGMVFRATDRKYGRQVAVKMLTSAARQDPQFVERLIREQQALQALAGTHAVGAIDLCRAESGALCLVMEWLDGMDLEHRLGDLEQQGVQMDTRELLAVMRPVLDTLQKAHELGIVHRDIKPANIFLLSGERGVRLLDFGLSRLKSSATLTAVDTVMGSPSYIAPEAWQGGSRLIGKQADLYSAAVIVYRALAGRVPFQAASLIETMTLVTRAARPSVTAYRSDLSPVVDQWVERALAIDPAQRFQYASSFQQALIAVLNGLPIPRHTLPEATKPGAPSTPAPVVTASERKNAVTTALERAATLLKRLAGTLSRAPRIPTPSAPRSEPVLAPEPMRAAPPPRRPRVTLPPVPRRRSVPARPAARAAAQLERPSAVADTVPAIAERSGASSSKQEPKTEAAGHAAPAPERDALITDLLAPSVVPGPADPDAVGARATAATSGSETGKPEGTPEIPSVAPEPAVLQSNVPAPAAAAKPQAAARGPTKAAAKKKAPQSKRQRVKAATKPSRTNAKQAKRTAKKSAKSEQRPKSEADQQKRQKASQPAPPKKRGTKTATQSKPAKKVASKSATAGTRGKAKAPSRKRQAKKA